MNGINCKGKNWLHRIYNTKTRPIFLVVPDNSPHVLKSMLNVDNIDEKKIENILLNLDADDIIDFCKSEKNIDVVRIERLNNLKKENTGTNFTYEGNSCQFMFYPNHPIGYLVIFSPVSVRMMGTACNNIRSAPKYGEHTLEIIATLKFKLNIFMGISLEWSKSYLPYAAKCNICMDNGKKLVSLSCSHSICYDCIQKNSLLSKCPVCKVEHNLDLEILADNFYIFRQHYRNWRKGSFKGSTDMQQITTIRKYAKRSKSFPIYIKYKNERLECKL